MAHSPFRRWRHVRRGTDYVEIGRARLQCDAPVGDNAWLVVYRGPKGKLWCRPPREFGDGRFIPIDSAEPT
jgi:hypothetical protein